MASSSTPPMPPAAPIPSVVLHVRREPRWSVVSHKVNTTLIKRKGAGEGEQKIPSLLERFTNYSSSSLPMLNDEHHQAPLAAVTSTAINAAMAARCGVAIWRLSSKNSAHHRDDVVVVLGSGDRSSSTTTTRTTMLEEYYSCNNYDVIPLSEGENWVTLCGAVGEEEIMVDGFRDPSKAKTSTTITISVKGNDDIIVAADDEKVCYSNALLCIDVDNDGPCVTVKVVGTKTTNDENDVDDCRPCLHLARRKKGLQCGGGRKITSTTRVNDVNSNNSPPEEVDATSNDENPSLQVFLYDSSVPLPPRQLRLLHDGDRILIRKIDQQGCIVWGVKLEYLQNIEQDANAISGRDNGKVEVNGTTALTRVTSVKSDTPTQEKRISMHFPGATPTTNDDDDDDDDDDLVHSEDELLSQPDCSVFPKHAASQWKERRRIEAEEEKMEAPPKHLSLHRDTKNTSQSIAAMTHNFDDDGDSTECSNDDEEENEEEYPKQILNHNVINKSMVHQSEVKGKDEDDSTECPDDEDAEMGKQTIPTEYNQRATCAIIKLSSTDANTPADSAANQSDSEDKDDVKDDSPECHQGVEPKLARKSDLTTPRAADESIETKSVKENINSKDSANSSSNLQTSIIGNGVSNPNAEDAADLYETKEEQGAHDDSAECHKRDRSTEKDITDFTDLRHNTNPPTGLPTKSSDIDANDSTGDVMEYQAETQESLDECFQAETQALFFPSTNTLEKIFIDEEENRSASPAKPDLSQNDRKTVLTLCATELKNGSPPLSSDKSAAENADLPANILHHSLSPRDRKRKHSLSKRRGDSNDIIKIVFTSIIPTRIHRKMIHDIGAQLVETIEEASSATRE